MLKYIETTGKNEEEAISKALAQLGLDRDDISVEVLERAKTGFLGIGSVPAKIRATYEVPDEEPVSVPEPEPEPEPVATESRKERRWGKRFHQERTTPEEPGPEPSPVPEADQPAPVPAPETPEPVDANEAEDAGPDAADSDFDSAEASERIMQFMSGLFTHMGVNAVPVVTLSEPRTYKVVLQGEHLGALIGRRGETLDAIQHLTSYAVNRGQTHRIRVHVDAENYRIRREESLQRLARKMAAKAIKYHRNMTLEPMNAYERHVIHTTLQNYPSVSTYSTGSEPNRRTIVAYDPTKK